MDPKKRARTVGRVEIVREAVPRRKIRLSDIMSEGFSKYLMELDGDFIAPTGARLSRMEEATAAEIGPLAAQNAKDRKARGAQPDQRADWLEAETEIREKEEAAAAAAAAARSEEWQAEMSQALPQVDPPTPAPTPTLAPPPATTPATTPATPPGTDDGPGDERGIDTDVIRTDNDDARRVAPDGDDVSGFDDPVGREGGGATVEPNDEAPKVKAPEAGAPKDVQQSDDIQGTETPTDDPSKDLGGPDEFDEKNKAFTSYIDGLITGVPAAAAGGDSLPAVSESLLLRPRSLIEAVYGSQKIEIVNYKRSR